MMRKSSGARVARKNEYPKSIIPTEPGPTCAVSFGVS